MCHITTWEEDYKGNNTSPSLQSPLANSSTPSCNYYSVTSADGTVVVIGKCKLLERRPALIIELFAYLARLPLASNEQLMNWKCVEGSRGIVPAFIRVD
jgi:hypothetical protein